MDKNEVRRISSVIFFVIFSIGTFLVGLAVGTKGEGVFDSVRNVKYQLTGDLSSEVQIEEIDFDTFWSVWNYLEVKYVDKNIDKKQMFYGAVKGMVEALDDPATLFLTQEETDRWDKISSGEFSGIGAELGYEGGYIVVKDILDDTPAERSDLEVGDVIMEVDGENVEGKNLTEVVLKIHGEEGTDVVLTVYRLSEDQNIDITITRGKIDTDNVRFKELEDRIILLKIDRFTESDLQEFLVVWDNVIEEINVIGPSALIIDLRGNPGGYLDGAVYAAGDFIEQGDTVLYVEDRDGNTSAKVTKKEGSLKSLPVVVLVDRDSASASEIFAGALQYYERAVIVGEKTVGKGTAQEVITESDWDGASLHITVQKWLLPNKVWLNKDSPIVPDIELSNDPDDVKLGKDAQLEKAKEIIRKE